MRQKWDIFGLWVAARLPRFTRRRSFGKRAGDFQVSVNEALYLWEQKKAMIIDVRSAEEYQALHIPGAKFIPLDQLGDRTTEIPKDQTVLIICSGGNSSMEATTFLRGAGFANVYSITGGMHQWWGPVNRDKTANAKR